MSFLPVTGMIAHRAGELRSELSKRGITRTQADMLIAATAQIHGLTQVTRNTRDFETCGIDLLNPFSTPAPPNPRQAPQRNQSC